VCLDLAKRFEEASVEYEQLVVVEPKHFPYLIRLASCYAELNRLSEAENLLKSKIDAGVENSSVWKLYGDIFAKQGKVDESEKAYAKAKTF
jgi:predicted Zn-dependent protease